MRAIQPGLDSVRKSKLALSQAYSLSKLKPKGTSVFSFGRGWAVIYWNVFRGGMFGGEHGRAVSAIASFGYDQTASH